MGKTATRKESKNALFLINPFCRWGGKDHFLSPGHQREAPAMPLSFGILLLSRRIIRLHFVVSAIESERQKTGMNLSMEEQCGRPLEWPLSLPLSSDANMAPFIPVYHF
jgi:hypothetical protein